MKSVAAINHCTGANEIVHAGLCVGCGSCVALSADPHACMSWDRYGQLKPKRGLTGESFGRICPFSAQAKNEDEIAADVFAGTRQRDRAIGRFEAAYVGHVEEGEFRKRGSSGGMVSWVAVELLRHGLVDGVVHVIATDRQSGGRLFRYAISRNEAEVRAGACSRYYPVDLSDALLTIRETPGRYAVVGIPCFIKAINLLRLEDPIFKGRIICTLGLFCGHMKSARFVDSLAWQVGVDPAAVNAVDYRVKTPDRPANWYRARLTLADGTTQEKDWWHLADGDWGAGFFQNSACNYCDDVVAETADIAFGDAWIEPYSSDGRGTNVVIVRKPELDALLRQAARQRRILLRPVGAEVVQETQAAGLRQRREGLAYRLAWKPPLIALGKRVAPQDPELRTRRKLIYRLRFLISGWSHSMFVLAKGAHVPALYLLWAHVTLRIYQGLTYSRGGIGRLFDTLESFRLRR